MYNTKKVGAFVQFIVGSTDLNAQKNIEIIGARYISQFHFPKFHPLPKKNPKKNTHTWP